MTSSTGTRDTKSAKASRKWWILAVLCISVLLVAIDNTIVNVALPTLSKRIGASTANLQWIVTAYSLLFAGLLLVAGHLGDRMGRKRILQIGLVLFTLTSLAAARSTSVDQLILARAGMGVAAAMIYPSTLALLSSTFTDRKQKAAAIGIWSGVSGLAVGMGPLAGGLLLEHYWWGSIFIVNIPVAAVALIAGARLVPESRDPAPGRFDSVGALLSVASIGLLVWAVIEAPVRGWTDAITILAFAGVVVLLVTFIFWESRHTNPLLEVRFFANPRFSAAAAAISMAFFGLFGFIFVITLYFQLIRGYSTLHAGLATLPFAVVMGGLSPVAILLMKRFGTKLVVTIGMLLMSAGFIVAALAPLDASYWRIIVVAMVLMAAGLALSTGPATDAILGSLPKEKVGVGSAVNDTTREVGGVLGVAVTGSVMSWYYGNRLGAAWGALGLPHSAVEIGKGSVGAGLALARTVPSAQVPAVTDALKNSFMTGMHAGSVTVAVVTFAGAIAAWLFLPRRDMVVPSAVTDVLPLDEMPVLRQAGSHAAAPR
ncbi:MAG TPA: DHA2 family efflux MFS transporter permease subunit [Streptosporangiaceae bacterium]|nr:DHA2 family efflux MFS transporter permease subunit [Streptosporangiaceae bacterium]